jgi:soluble lytic murein transglycosylase-like protein
MRNLPGSTRLFLFSIPIFASILVQSWKAEQPVSLAPSFLELHFPSFQEKYAQRGRFSPAIKIESNTIGQWIAATMGGRGWSEETIQDLSLFIVLKSREFRLSPYLVASLIQVESAFDPNAVSPKGAVGLMQLMPATAKELAADRGIPFRGASSLVDPKLNIYLGLHYMSELRSKFPDHQEFLTAYNIGPAALARKLKAGDEVSLDYYEKVMGTMSQFQRGARKKGKVSWL